ncbi:MAG: efflux RND transporter periplasmic adaptor subunit, partial [Geobacteraceae bacterium]|nr:efflux RND transporter periplasmic adaptor subunit [Geobacteraceae bacterium]
MNKKIIIIGLVLAVALGGGFLYRSNNIKSSGVEKAEHKEDGHKDEKEGGHKEGGEHKGEEEGHEGHDEHGEAGIVKMTAALQKENGVVVAPAKKQRLGGAISATGKVEVNADRIAHVSPRISGKIVAVRASLGDSVAAGQPLATLDSVELGEALNRYQQSKTKLALAQSNMDRIKGL